MGLDGDVVSKRGNRSGDPRKITKELLDPDGFWSWLQTISTAWVRRCSSMIINMRKIQNRSFELQVKEIETVNEYCVYCVCVLCINPVKQIIYTVLVSAWDVEIYIPDQEAVHRLHFVFECFVFKALVWMSGAALLKSAGLDMNDTVWDISWMRQIVWFLWLSAVYLQCTLS